MPVLIDRISMRSNSGLYGREETADPALDGYIDGDNIWRLWSVT